MIQKDQLTKKEEKLSQQYTHLKLETDNQDKLAVLKE
jgi:hypothetical protein